MFLCIFSPPQLSSKPGFFRHNSERRSFKLLELRKTGRDTGFSSPSRISPPSTPSSPDDTPCLSGDPCNRRRRKIPKVRESERHFAELTLLCLWFMVPGSSELVHSCCRLGMGTFSDGYFLWEVCSEEGLPEAVLNWFYEERGQFCLLALRS